MKPNIHPTYQDTRVRCQCGNTFITRSTACEPIQLDVCAECHPSYTGLTPHTVTSTRVAKFYRKYPSASLRTL